MKKKVLFITISLLFFSVGCTQQLTEKAGSQEDIIFRLESATPSVCAFDTKTSYSVNADEQISDFTIFVFDKHGDVVSANYYQGNANMSGRSLFVNDNLHTTFNDLFDVYIIANLGDLRKNNDLCTSGVPDKGKMVNFSYTFSGNFSEFGNKGFPMAGYYDNYRPETDSRTLYVDRLVTQYNIRFTKSSRNPNTYTITGGRLGNVASKCTPFKQFKASSSSETINIGDEFSASDISALNGGGTASLFVLENEQGVVFPSSVNTERLRKMESFPSGSVLRQVCTYLEFDVTVETPTATYGNVTYRYFFGDALRDCSVHRNMVYTLTMNFDSILVEDEGWRIDPDDPSVDDDSLTLSRTQLSIIKGMYNTFTVTRKPNVEYNMTYSQTDAQAYGVTILKESSGNEDTYTVSTSYTPVVAGLSEVPKVDYVDIPITFTTTDGLVSKSFNIRVDKNPLFVEFSFSDGFGEANVSNTVDWPSGTTFETSVTGVLYGENQYCSNRLLQYYCCDVWQSNLGVYSSSEDLNDGDAATDDFHTVDLNTSAINMAMHNLNASHPVDHHYAVGSTEVHYTAVGHAYLKIYYAVKIDGSVASVPVMVITTRGSARPRSTFMVDEEGRNTYMSFRPDKVPAWYYEPWIDDNFWADDVESIGAAIYDTAGAEYPVYLNSASMRGFRTYVRGSNSGILRTLNFDGSSCESYYPQTGIDIIYGLQDQVSY